MGAAGRPAFGRSQHARVTDASRDRHTGDVPTSRGSSLDHDVGPCGPRPDRVCSRTFHDSRLRRGRIRLARFRPARPEHAAGRASGQPREQLLAGTRADLGPSHA